MDMWNLATTRDEGLVGFIIVDDVVLLSRFVGMRYTKISQGLYLLKSAMNLDSGAGFAVDGSGPCSIGERRLRTASMSEFGIEMVP